MDDLIKRQDAIGKIKDWMKFIGYSHSERNVMECTIQMLEELPSAQKTGKWKLLHKGEKTSDYECTNCRGILMDVANDDSHELQRYCGMRGARMEVYGDNN